jgi:hypothetical protein
VISKNCGKTKVALKKPTNYRLLKQICGRAGGGGAPSSPAPLAHPPAASPRRPPTRVPLIHQQFKHIDSLRILKLKWNDITFQLSFSFRTRLCVLTIWSLLERAANTREESSFSIAPTAIQTHRFSSDFETEVEWLHFSTQFQF